MNTPKVSKINMGFPFYINLLLSLITAATIPTTGASKMQPDQGLEWEGIGQI